MFDLTKFGAYISKLRKSKDLTQSELADILNVTRQAVSKWEMGDSFPDITLLTTLSDYFNVSIDNLINAGEPHKSETEVLVQAAKGTPEKVVEMLERNEMSVETIVSAAPFLKASTLDIIAKGFEKNGIDISNVVELAAYMNEATINNLIEKASFEKLDEGLLAKFVPFLSHESLLKIFDKILNGELSINMLPIIKPYYGYILNSYVEAAVMDGGLNQDAITILRE